MGSKEKSILAQKIPLDTIIETILQSKNKFTAEVLDMQNGISTNLRKKLAKCSEHFISDLKISVQVLFYQKKQLFH